MILSAILILIAITIVIMIIGFMLIILGSIKNSERRVEGGGVIIIGPLPIVIGTNEKISKILLVLAITLTLLSLILFLVAPRLIEFYLIR